MRVLQPTGWPKPRGYSHGYELQWPGRWVVLGGQTGGDGEGNYPQAMGDQVRNALQRIVTLLEEAGAKPKDIVRLNWYITDRAAYEAAGAAIGAAWKATLEKSFPPATLLYVSGLVDARALVEIEVTAFVLDAAQHF